MKAIWNGKVLAESDDTIVVEGNHYFPEDSINKEFFAPSETHTVCGWKGTASYYDVVVGDETNKDAAWFYPDRRKMRQRKSKTMSRFWKGVANNGKLIMESDNLVSQLSIIISTSIMINYSLSTLEYEKSPHARRPQCANADGQSAAGKSAPFDEPHRSRTRSRSGFGNDSAR